MPRNPRVHYPNAIYHVMLRGNHGADIFFSYWDRIDFCSLLKEVVEKYDCIIHAFCLMTNHVHLAVQVNHVPLSKIMHKIAFCYAQIINHKMQKNGHLFQGRYKALLIDNEKYLVNLVKYIHLNPIRAGLVNDLTFYKWSSHASYIGEEDFPWVRTDITLGLFSENRSLAIKEYLNYIAAEMEPESVIVTFKKSKTFKQIQFEGILEKVDFYFKENQDVKKHASNSQTRAVASLLAKEYKVGTYAQMAEYFQINISTLAHAISRIKNHIVDLDDIKEFLKKSGI